MKVWILKDSEPLPLTPEVKPLRAAMLSEALVARGHAVRWWCSTMSHFHKTREAQAGSYTLENAKGTYNVQRIEAGLYARNLSVARVLHHRRLAKCWREAAEQSHETPNIILVAYPIIEWVREALAYAKPRGIPVVVDVRDQWPDTFVNYAPSLLKPFVWLVAKILYPNVPALFRAPRAVTSMSTPVLHWALHKARRAEGDDTRVFYLGTSLSQTLQQSTRTQLPTDRPTRCLFLGTLGHTADVLTIGQAARYMHENNQNVHITIAGDGDYMQSLRDVVEGLPNVTLTGWRSTADAKLLLAASDIALLTGHNEAMPNKFFDYVAAGLPIVCSLRGEVRDYITRHHLGACCPSGDAQALARAINHVREHYSACAKAVQAVPASDYACDAIYASFVTFLEQLGNHHAV
ncbi:MAG: glycosyltransferase family 4 protein [Rickettsiales bacterium]